MRQAILDENEEDLRPEPKSGRRIFLILFLSIFVLIFGVLGTTMVYSAYRKEKTCSMPTTGRIIDYNDHSYNNKHKYTPIIEYRVGDQVFSSETNIRFNYHPFKKGEYVSVYYNPKSPDEFYMKEYDLRTLYILGAVFLLVSIGIIIVSALCAIIGKIKINQKKKAQIQIKIFLSAILLFMFTIFSCLAGLGKTICIFIAIGLFALYGIHQNKRKK